MALDRTTTTHTASPTTGSIGTQDVAMGLRPSRTASLAGPATGTTGAQELEGIWSAMTPGPAAAQATQKAVAPLAATGLLREEPREGERELERRRNRSRGDVFRASSSSSSTEGTGRGPALEITGINSKRQVVPSLPRFLGAWPCPMTAPCPCRLTSPTS